AALPGTLQRFSFAYQWFAIENAFREWAGPESLVGQRNNWTLNSAAGFSKLFSTAALLTFAFAINTVFNFVGAARDLLTASTLSLGLVQRLLRGGGKAVALEPLTQVERNLVYDIRSFFRFREQFYVSIVLGSNLPGSLATAAGIGGGG